MFLIDEFLTILFIEFVFTGIPLYIIMNYVLGEKEVKLDTSSGTALYDPRGDRLVLDRGGFIEYTGKIPPRINDLEEIGEL